VGVHDTFVSYSTSDAQVVSELVNTLAEAYGVDLYFAPTELAMGSALPGALVDAMAQARTFLLLVGPRGLGKWQKLELQHAQHLETRGVLEVVPVLLPGASAETLASGALGIIGRRHVTFGTKLDAHNLERLAERLLGRSLAEGGFLNAWVERHLNNAYEARKETVVRSVVQSMSMSASAKVDFSVGRRQLTEAIFCSAAGSLNKASVAPPKKADRGAGDSYYVISTLRFWRGLSRVDGPFHQENVAALLRGVSIKRLFFCRDPRSEDEHRAREHVKDIHLRLMKRHRHYECVFAYGVREQDLDLNFGVVSYGRSGAFRVALEPVYEFRPDTAGHAVPELSGLEVKPGFDAWRTFRDLWDQYGSDAGTLHATGGP